MKASKTIALSACGYDCLVQGFTGASVSTAVRLLVAALCPPSSIPRRGNDVSESAFCQIPVA